MENLCTIGFDDLAESREFHTFFEIARDLTGLFMELVSPDGEHSKILHSREAETPLCRLINSVAEGRESCRATDLRGLARATKKKSPCRYRCHAGLIDITIPIYVNERHAATIICGQLLSEPASNAGFKRLCRRLRRLNLPQAALRRAYFSSPYIPPQKIRTAVRLLSFFAEHFGEAGWKIKQMNSKLFGPVQKAINFMREHYREPIRLKDISRAAGLSPSYFSACFHRHVGQGVAHYLSAVRIKAAQRLLRASTARITETAFEVGFSNQSCFNRVFRNICGCTPSEYRLQFRRRKRGAAVSE